MADAAAAAPALGAVGVDCVRNDNILAAAAAAVSFRFRSVGSAFTSFRSLSVEFVAGAVRSSSSRRLCWRYSHEVSALRCR